MEEVQMEAVINALEVIEAEVDRGGDTPDFSTEAINRWVFMLPGDAEKWEPLLMRSGDTEWVGRPEFLAHARATIAYLKRLQQKVRG